MKIKSERERVRFLGISVSLVILWLGVSTFQSCRHKPKKTDDLSRFTSETGKIGVDESFRPIVDEELYVFKALNNKAHPVMIYAPENTIINLLLADSIRVLLTARDLNAQEYQMLAAKNIRPVVSRFAVDAVALIVNQASSDTTITVSDIKKMLNGYTKQDKNIVFDNPNSGLVRYLEEFSGNKDLKGKNIFSLKSNKEVIKYVSEHANAIGITGFGWLNDPDKDYADALQKVKIVSVRNDTGEKPSQQYFAPSQTTLALRQYPLTRNLYFIDCTGKYGLGMEFATFLEGDRGQRIILKSGLLPDLIPDREINIVQKMK
jgi:phosphate transport system substrate-binding protein